MATPSSQAMRRGRLALGLALLGGLAPAAAAPVEPVTRQPSERPEDHGTVDLAGPWRYLPHEGAGDFCSPEVDDSGWATMHLPSNWFLLGRREYPPRALADQPLSILSGGVDLPAPDPDEGLDYSGTVYFRRTVELSPVAGRRALLDLDMVDYLAEVHINGVPVGRHQGSFQRFSLDVTAALRPGENLVCIKVSAPALIVDMAQQHPVSWPKQQDQIKGVFGYHDARPGGTSRRGQARSTGGIVGGVALRWSEGVELAGLTVTPIEVSPARARLSVEATVRRWGEQGAPVPTVPVVVEGEIAQRLPGGPGPVRARLRLPLSAGPGESRGRAEVVIERPALWWTWDLGEPNLYQLFARLVAADGATLDQRTEVFGVRSIRRDPGWVFRLNGQRIYLRGSNYISTQWLSQADRAFYQRDLALMRGAHLNAIRVHAHLERPEFYRLADEAGLLVWQDFPLQWGYADLPAFHAEALRQAGEMIEQLRNHPSIFLWCMHNEAPHAMAWMKKRVADQNLALDEKLAELARRLDPSRVVLRDSGTDDGHFYYGWYHDSPGKLRPLPPHVQPLVSEFGAQALPVRESLERTIEPRALWPRDDHDWEAWRFADFQPQPTFEVARIERGPDLDHFIASSQRYQAALIRFQTEVFRRAKWTRSTGLFHFMLVDPWPAITWSVVDYFRREKAGYRALVAAMQPVLPSIEYQIDDPSEPLRIHVINDRPRALARARLTWTLSDPEGHRLDGGERRLEVPADAVIEALDLGPRPAIAAGRARLQVWLLDSAGRTVGHSSLGAGDYVTARR